MAKKKKTPAQRRDAHDKGPPVDSFKVFHLAVALAPVFTREYLDGKIGLDHDDVAAALVHFATAIARRL